MDVSTIATLVTRLVGDVSGFIGPMQSAAASAQQTAKQVEASSKLIEGFSKSLSSFASQAGGALAALGTFSWLSGARSAFEEAEKNTLKLRAAIEAGGHAVAATEADYRKFAQAIQDVTALSRGEVLASLRKAESYGLSGAAAKSAVQSAIALSSVTDADTDSLLRLTAALARGDVALAMHAGRLVPQLRGIKDESTFVARATALMDLGWKQATIEGATNSAVINRLWLSLKSLRNEIGEIVSTALRPLIAALQEGVNWFLALDPAVRRSIVVVGSLTAGFLLLKPAIAFLGPVLSLALSPLRLLTVAALGLPTLWGSVSIAIGTVAGVLGGLLPVVLALVNPINLIAFAFGTLRLVVVGMAGILGTVFSPITLLVVAAGLGIKALVDQFGGLSKAWAAAREGASGVWEGIKAGFSSVVAAVRPITDALVSLFSTTWEAVKAGAQNVVGWLASAWGAVKDALAGALESSGINPAAVWEGIRDAIIATIRVVEYAVRNFGAAASAVWGGILSAAQTAWDGIKAVFASDTMSAVWERIKLGAAQAWEFVATTVASAVVVISAAISGIVVVVVAVWDALAAVKDVIVDAGTAAYTWAASFQESTRGIIATVAGIAGAFLGVYATIKVVVFGIGLINAVLAFLHVQQVVSVAAWLLWQGVVIAATVTMGIFNVAFTVFSFLLGSSAAGTGLWATAVLIAKGAVWLLNAALTVTNVLLGVAALAAAAVTVGILTTAFVFAAAAVWGVYRAVDYLIMGLALIPTASGPIGAVAALFSEWWGIIQDVVRAVRVDLNLAWSIAAAGFGLAVAQIKELWPPLWQFIKAGFAALWKLVSSQFEVEFNRALINMKATLAQWMDIFGLQTSRMKDLIDASNRIANSQNTEIMIAAAKALEDAIGAFEFKESDAIKERRAALRGLQEDLARAELMALDWMPEPDVIDPKKQQKAIVDAMKFGGGIGQAMTTAFKAEKVDAVLFGSAEALSRIAAFRDRMAGVGRPPVLDLAAGGKSAAADIAGAATKLADAGAAAGKAIVDAGKSLPPLDIAIGDVGPLVIAAGGAAGAAGVGLGGTGPITTVLDQFSNAVDDATKIIAAFDPGKAIDDALANVAGSLGGAFDALFGAAPPPVSPDVALDVGKVLGGILTDAFDALATGFDSSGVIASLFGGVPPVLPDAGASGLAAFTASLKDSAAAALDLVTALTGAGTAVQNDQSPVPVPVTGFGGDQSATDLIATLIARLVQLAEDDAKKPGLTIDNADLGG